jgi:hypothetical protein
MPTSTGVRETATYIPPEGLAGVEALQADLDLVGLAFRRRTGQRTAYSEGWSGIPDHDLRPLPGFTLG